MNDRTIFEAEPAGPEPCEYWDEDGCYCICGAMCACDYGYDPAFVKEVLAADAAPSEAGFDNRGRSSQTLELRLGADFMPKLE